MYNIICIQLPIAKLNEKLLKEVIPKPLKLIK